LIPEALENPGLSWYGNTMWGGNVLDQFKKYTYPISKEQGGTKIHMIWTDSPCWVTCWNNGYRFIEVLGSLR